MEDGIVRCEAALQRLKDGKPFLDVHVGLDRSKITAGKVSVEAGYDRGYLKKSRQEHRILLAKIEAYRSERVSSSESLASKLARAKQKCNNLERDLRVAEETMYRVLTQNLQLVESISNLEKQLALAVRVRKL